MECAGNDGALDASTDEASPWAKRFIETLDRTMRPESSQ